MPAHIRYHPCQRFHSLYSCCISSAERKDLQGCTHHVLGRTDCCVALVEVVPIQHEARLCRPLRSRPPRKQFEKARSHSSTLGGLRLETNNMDDFCTASRVEAFFSFRSFCMFVSPGTQRSGPDVSRHSWLHPLNQSIRNWAEKEAAFLPALHVRIIPLVDVLAVHSLNPPHPNTPDCRTDVSALYPLPS